MYEKSRGYRQLDHEGWMKTGRAVLYIIIMLLPSLAWPQGQAERGQPIYARDCARCHGADGRGGPMASMLSVPPRNLADQAYMQARTAEQLFEVIKQGGSAQGLSAAMPGFGNQLSDAQVWDTVAYIRTLAGATSAARSQPEGTAPPAGDIRIQRLSVSIWPEYDDPRVLVILRGELSPESQVPTRLRLPMPKGAELLGAGMISPQNELLNHPHERLEGEVADTLELTLPVRRFFAEWYYNPFGERKPERQFTYPFPLPYAVAQLNVDILQPDAATDFRVTPSPMREEVDHRGGKHHLFSYRDLKPESAQTFEVAYVKATDEPSVAKSTPPSADARADHSPTGLSRDTKTWVTFAMLAGFTAIFAGGVLVFRNKQPAILSAEPPEPDVPAPVMADEGAVNPPETAGDVQNYCSNCGRQLQATYLFCPGCGRSLQAS